MENRSFATAIAVTLTLGFGSPVWAADIVETASNDARFSTLVAAISAAGLTEALQGDGPFTVYAPLNAAFEALDPGTVQALLMPENKVQLTNVLLYHVDDRRITSAAIPTGATQFKPMNTSERFCIRKDASGLRIDDGSGQTAQIVVADIQADNGVIHVIDKVLLPGTRPACR